jgi:hypothetical protein
MNPPAPAELTLSNRLMPGAFPREATSPRLLTGVPRMSPRNTQEYGEYCGNTTLPLSRIQPAPPLPMGAK